MKTSRLYYILAQVFVVLGLVGMGVSAYIADTTGDADAKAAYIVFPCLGFMAALLCGFIGQMMEDYE